MIFFVFYPGSLLQGLKEEKKCTLLLLSKIFYKVFTLIKLMLLCASILGNIYKNQNFTVLFRQNIYHA